jgi:hypothetical protein
MEDWADMWIAVLRARRSRILDCFFLLMLLGLVLICSTTELVQTASPYVAQGTGTHNLPLGFPRARITMSSRTLHFSMDKE